MAGAVDAIENLLLCRIGLDPASVGTPLIERAMRLRIKDLNLASADAYLQVLLHSETEIQELIEEVVVPESWFFRDDRPFQWLRTYVSANWLADLGRSPLRILSMPCAAGEEPFSIAITLHDLGLPLARFHIDAVDVSARHLALAQSGRYSQNAFRGTDDRLRALYFHRHQQGYELDGSIRQTVRFIQASVLAPDLLWGSLPYDIVFCRNLLIYLATPARARVLAAIERLLSPGGILFVGHADRIDSPERESNFTSVGDPGCFAFRHGRPKAAEASLVPVVSSVRLSGSLAPQTEPFSLAPPRQPAMPALSSSPAAEAASLHATTPQPALLEEAALLTNDGRFDEAITLCERHLRTKGYSPSAFFLLGMIYQAAGKRERAEECFHKTLYLEPSHAESLLALALLAERRGDKAVASAFRRRAARIAADSRKDVS
jgi:chemotaxis protein methyltransferase WspC